MQNVVSLTAFAQAKEEAIEVSKSVYGRMRSGELNSVIYITRGSSGRAEIGVAGDFVNDMATAERAAVAGFEAIFGHPIGTRRPLPRDLKKGYQ